MPLVGSGYSLTVTRDVRCDVPRTTSVIQECMQKAFLKNEAAGQLTYNLPESETAQFPHLFEKLESMRRELGILSFGLSVNTVEDVFLKVSPEKIDGGDHDDDEEDEMIEQNGNGRAQNGDGEHKVDMIKTPYVRLTGFNLWISQMTGLLMKRLIYLSRRWLLYTIMVR